MNRDVLYNQLMYRYEKNYSLSLEFNVRSKFIIKLNTFTTTKTVILRFQILFNPAEKGCDFRVDSRSSDGAIFGAVADDADQVPGLLSSIAFAISQGTAAVSVARINT